MMVVLTAYIIIVQRKSVNGWQNCHILISGINATKQLIVQFAQVLPQILYQNIV